MTLALILYKDGLFQVFPYLDDFPKHNFEEGTRFFKTMNYTTLGDIALFLGNKLEHSSFEEF